MDELRRLENEVLKKYIDLTNNDDLVWIRNKSQYNGPCSSHVYSTVSYPNPSYYIFDDCGYFRLNYGYHGTTALLSVSRWRMRHLLRAIKRSDKRYFKKLYDQQVARNSARKIAVMKNLLGL